MPQTLLMIICYNNKYYEIDDKIKGDVMRRFNKIRQGAVDLIHDYFSVDRGLGSLEKGAIKVIPDYFSKDGLKTSAREKGFHVFNVDVKDAKEFKSSVQTALGVVHFLEIKQDNGGVQRFVEKRIEYNETTAYWINSEKMILDSMDELYGYHHMNEIDGGTYSCLYMEYYGAEDGWVLVKDLDEYDSRFSGAIKKELARLVSLGIVHNDIKHDNVFYNVRTGEARIFDFGKSFLKRDPPLGKVIGMPQSVIDNFRKASIDLTTCTKESIANANDSRAVNVLINSYNRKFDVVDESSVESSLGETSSESLFLTADDLNSSSLLVESYISSQESESLSIESPVASLQNESESSTESGPDR